MSFALKIPVVGRAWRNDAMESRWVPRWLSGRRAPSLSRVLRSGEAVSFDSGRSGMEIAVIEGMVWITQFADPVDHVLASGDRIRLPGRGRIVVMALRAAQFTAGPVVSVRSAPNDSAEAG
jgi:hypothetical protein